MSMAQLQSLEDRLSIAERMLDRIEDSLRTLETTVDLLVNYTRAAAQAQGLRLKARSTYEQLDATWEAILRNRKDRDIG